ncbi:MAG: helix-turn-helix transcriptional regulator, partial [Phaeodactylibacter sp.]|nr:helix-turn-helix transcriptional regulator [Phaeodactylibacter sp.]
LQSLLFLFLNELKRTTAPEKDGDLVSNEMHYYQLFINQVEADFAKNRSIEDYAHQLNISSRHLNRLIKQIAGSTLNQLIQQRRLLESKRLLRYSNKTISEIAYRTGYSDPSYFIRIFKKETDQTPAAFRTNA